MSSFTRTVSGGGVAGGGIIEMCYIDWSSIEYSARVNSAAAQSHSTACTIAGQASNMKVVASGIYCAIWWPTKREQQHTQCSIVAATIH